MTLHLKEKAAGNAYLPVGRDFTGRSVCGYIIVNPDGVKTKKDLEYWLNRPLDYNKKAKAASKRTRK